MQGVFITGTNTEVGKTFVAVEIARRLCQRDIKVIPRNVCHKRILLFFFIGEPL